MAPFAELYCQYYRVPPERYASSMFWRCLHRRTWLLVPFLKLVSSDYFSADHDLIRDVGRLTRATGLTEDLGDYHTHPLNGSFARRRLRFRISVRRVTKEVHRLLPGRAPTTFYDSTKPFADDPAGASRSEDTPPHSASS
jgi:hypothetical protein